MFHHFLPPRKMLTILQIFQIVHVPIRLAFKTDVEIGIAPFEQTNQPFCHIPQVEPHHQHLQHLMGVDALVIDQLGRQTRVAVAEKHAEQVHRIKTLQREESIADNFHYADKVTEKIYFFKVCERKSDISHFFS